MPRSRSRSRALALVLLGGHSLRWRSPAGGAAATSFVCIVAFVRVERRCDYPAIDLTLLRSSEFLAMCIAPVATSVGYWSLLIYVPQFARDVMGLRPVEAGWLLTVLATVPMLLLPRLGAVLALRMVAGVFFSIGADDHRRGRRRAGGHRMGRGPHGSDIGRSSRRCWAAASGAALIQSQTSAAAVGAVPGGRAAMASAICVTMRQLGFSLGIALLGFLLQAGGGGTGFALAFAGAAVVTLAAAGTCYALNRR